MGEEYRAKVFKSGNSLALRLPKSLGLNDGEEVVMIPHADGSFSFWNEHCQCLPDMWQTIPQFEFTGHACGLVLCCQPAGVIQQHLILTDLDQCRG